MNKPNLRVIPGGRPVPPAPPPPKMNLLASLLCRWVMSHVRVDPDAVQRVRQLALQGTLVYVMRYRSLVDYLLAVYLLMREGLPAPEFGNDISALLLQPVREIVSTLWRRLWAWQFFGRELRRFQERERCQRLVRQNRSVLIFLRQRSRVGRFARRRSQLREARTGTDYLREIVHGLAGREQTVFLVPLAVIRGKGYRRRESRIATLLYSVQEAPGEAKRLASLAWNRDSSQLTVGTEIPLGDFVELHRHDSEERIGRRLARLLQLYLYREERMVWGPLLLPKREVRRQVLKGDDLTKVVRQVAAERGEPESKVWRKAEQYFDEMAANFHGSYFAILEFAFNQLWPRMFQGLEYTGLERVVERVKEGPVVLVPCHRSHFDYLILSYIFHNNYLSPPHIAAGINLSFWPLGPLFRGAGAYFIRRTFEGNPLYKMVFRKYLAYLIREGYTQEFFIEGGRSRTGKILTPKLGMLSALVNAFREGARRDLYFVPVSIHYGRVVEEESYSRELSGAEKEKESLSALLRARAVVARKYGTVNVSFAEPISLAQFLGPAKERFHEGADNPVIEEEKRRAIRKLGFRLLREVNNAAVVGATSVSSSILLGAPHAAVRLEEFLVAAHALVRFLRDHGVQLTASLERNASADFRESIGFLEAGGLIQRIADPGGSVLHVPAQKRMTLDFYKNNSIHFFLLPSLLARGLVRGLRGGALKDEIVWWLDMFRWEFALPEREQVAAELGHLLDYFRAQGALAGVDGEAVDEAHALVRATIGVLDNYQEAYWIAGRTLSEMTKPLSRAAVIERVRKRYETSLLLGEVRKPEGNSSVTLGNALERFREMGLIVVQDAPRERDRVVRPGPRADAWPALLARLAPSARSAPAPR